MLRDIFWSFAVIAVFFVELTACSSSGSVAPAPGPDGSQDGHVAVVSSAPDGSVGVDTLASLPSPDGSQGGDSPGSCCPLDNGNAGPMPVGPAHGCMYLGGSSGAAGLGCGLSCDFFCSYNWRVEKDANGCDVWNYDTRQPKSGENTYCQPILDASGDAPAEGGAPCTGASDCRTFSDYCGGCACEALRVGAVDPVCDAGVAQCLADPCSGHTVACDATHRCALR